MKQISYHSVPDELYPYFWDTDVQALDLEKDKEYIISRLYNYGGTLGFIWVDRTYTDDDIKQIAIQVENSNLCLASPDDIACMKSVAIGSRGTKKDFFDLYYIMLENHISASDLLDMIVQKFGDQFDYTYIGIALGYFETANTQKLPETFVSYDWHDMKKFFADVSKDFLSEIDRRYKNQSFFYSNDHRKEI